MINLGIGFGEQSGESHHAFNMEEVVSGGFSAEVDSYKVLGGLNNLILFVRHKSPYLDEWALRNADPHRVIFEIRYIVERLRIKIITEKAGIGIESAGTFISGEG